MEPCPHTRLMNYFIGMCKKQRDWITVLAKLGYELQLVEQRVRTSTDQISHPDIVVSSNQLLHFLVCDCKGGITIDEDQIDRYSTLTKDNFANFIRPFAIKDFSLDVCLSDIEENHPLVLAHSKGFPILTFGKTALYKTGKFKQENLDSAFKEPINLEGMIPPLSYYPFSSEDTHAYIAPYVIRGLLSIATKNAKGGPSFADENIVTRDEIITVVFNQVYESLSDSHRKQLKDKIWIVIRWVLKSEPMREALQLIEGQGSIKVARQLDKLQKAAEEFIADLETRQILDDFLNREAN